MFSGSAGTLGVQDLIKFDCLNFLEGDEREEEGKIKKKKGKSDRGAKEEKESPWFYFFYLKPKRASSPRGLAPTNSQLINWKFVSNVLGVLINDPQLVRTNEAALRPHPHYCQNLPCPRIRSGWGRLFAFGGLNREVGGQSWYLVVNSTSFCPLKPNRTQFSGRPYFRAWVPALVAMESEYESFIGCNNCHRKGEPWLLFTFFIPLLHLWNRKVFFFEVLFL